MNRWLLPLLLPLLTMALVTCGGGSSDNGSVSAEEVLSRSADRFQSVKSFHFKLEHENGSTPIILGLGLTEAEGDFLMPDKLAAEAQAKAGPTTLRVKVVAIGDKTWITNPFTREFQRAPGNASILDIINPAALVNAVATDIRDPRLVGSDSIDGVDTYHIKGTISTDSLKEGLGFADSGRTVEVETWIGKGDYLLRQAKLKGPLTPDEPKDIARIIQLSKYDAAVTIEEPK